MIEVTVYSADYLNKVPGATPFKMYVDIDHIIAFNKSVDPSKDTTVVYLTGNVNPVIDVQETPTELLARIKTERRTELRMGRK